MNSVDQAVCSVCTRPVDEHPFLRDLGQVKDTALARGADPQSRVLCDGRQVLSGTAVLRQRATG